LGQPNPQPFDSFAFSFGGESFATGKSKGKTRAGSPTEG